MNRAFLLLGSNIGNRKENLLTALELLSENHVEIIQKSPIFETEPWGVNETQENYWNQAVEIRTLLFPFGLLKLIQEIETKLGRIEKGNYKSRTLDIDIIFFNDWRIHSPILTIPHKHFRERKFVLKPLHCIAEDFKDPESGMKIEDILNQVQDDLYIIEVS